MVLRIEKLTPLSLPTHGTGREHGGKEAEVPSRVDGTDEAACQVGPAGWACWVLSQIIKEAGSGRRREMEPLMHRYTADYVRLYHS